MSNPIPEIITHEPTLINKIMNYKMYILFFVILVFIIYYLYSYFKGSNQQKKEMQPLLPPKQEPSVNENDMMNPQNINNQKMMENQIRQQMEQQMRYEMDQQLRHMEQQMRQQIEQEMTQQMKKPSKKIINPKMNETDSEVKYEIDSENTSSEVAMKIQNVKKEERKNVAEQELTNSEIAEINKKLEMLNSA